MTVNLKFYNHSNHNAVCFYRSDRKRIIYRFPSIFKDNSNYLQKLVNVIQNKQNELDCINKHEQGTNYTLLNTLDEVVLVDKETFFANFK